MVDISPAAAKEIKRIFSNQSVSNSSLRLAVKSGGCSGLYYDLKIENPHSDGDSAKGDRFLKIDEICFRVDSQSWKYVEHLKLDYSEDLMGGGFRFHHPQIKNFCGCGISFAAADTDI